MSRRTSQLPPPHMVVVVVVTQLMLALRLRMPRGSPSKGMFASHAPLCVCVSTFIMHATYNPSMLTIRNFLIISKLSRRILSRLSVPLSHPMPMPHGHYSWRGPSRLAS